MTFTSAIGGARNALAPPHRVRTSRRARRALASTRRPPPPVAQIAGSASARGVMSSTADLCSRSGRPVDDDDLCTAVTAVEPMRDLLEGLPHLWGPTPLGTPQFGGCCARISRTLGAEQMAESSRLFSKADVRALRPSTSIADPGVVALQDELDRVGQQILLHAMRARTQRLREKPPHGRVDRQLTESSASCTHYIREEVRCLMLHFSVFSVSPTRRLRFQLRFRSKHFQP